METNKQDYEDSDLKLSFELSSLARFSPEQIKAALERIPESGKDKLLLLALELVKQLGRYNK